MNDKEKKILRYREENKHVKYGKPFLQARRLWRCFP